MMGKLFVAAILLSCPAWATWSLTQASQNSTCGNVSTCAVTTTSTGAHHLLVAGALLNGNVTISSVTAGACNVTWLHAPNTNKNNAGDGTLDMFYCTDSAAAQTSITINLSGSGVAWDAVIWEAASTLGTIALDTGTTPSGNIVDATCTSCAGVSLTLSGKNDFIAALAAAGGSLSGVTGTGWTNDFLDGGGQFAAAHGITSGSQNAPGTWTQSATGTLVGVAGAFQESPPPSPETLGLNYLRDVYPDKVVFIYFRVRSAFALVKDWLRSRKLEQALNKALLEEILDEHDNKEVILELIKVPLWA